jgi:hypothetical protein
MYKHVKQRIVAVEPSRMPLLVFLILELFVKVVSLLWDNSVIILRLTNLQYGYKPSVRM